MKTKFNKTLLALSLAATIASAAPVPTESYILENDISVSGVFFSHDFEGDGKIDYNDYVYAPVNSPERYRLLGNKPTPDDVFGWKRVTDEVEMPKKYVWSFAQIGDTDGDGSVKFDWVVIHNDTGKIYKLEGAKENGTFKYSKPLNTTAPTIDITSDDIENNVTVNISIDEDGSGNVQKVPVEEAAKVNNEPIVEENVSNLEAIEACKKAIPENAAKTSLINYHFQSYPECQLVASDINGNVFWNNIPLKDQPEDTKKMKFYQYMINLYKKSFENGIYKYKYAKEILGSLPDSSTLTVKEGLKMHRAIDSYIFSKVNEVEAKYDAEYEDNDTNTKFDWHSGRNGYEVDARGGVVLTGTFKNYLTGEELEIVTVTVL